MRNLLEKIYDFLTGKCIRRIYPVNTNEKVVYLTFDDGPDADCTPVVLDLLKRLDVKATFFVIGNKALKLKSLTERIIQEGHAIGNHTLDHDTTRYFSDASGIKDWIKESESILTQNLGIHPIGFRSPVGIKTPALNKALRILKMPLILWDVRFYDTTYGLSIKAVNKKMSHIQAGSIVLLHDTHKNERRIEFLNSLEHLIIETKKLGFHFQALDKNKITNQVNRHTL